MDLHKIIEPSKKLFIKQIFVLLTFTLIILIAAYLIDLVVSVVGEDSSVITVFWYVILILLALLWVIAIPLTKMWISNLRYGIRVDRISINKGIWTKIEQNIPFRSVTDFQLHRSIYDRILGIATIKIQTAGQSQSASGYEGILSGLTNFEELHLELREKIKSLFTKGGTVTTPDTTHNDQMLLLMLEELKQIRKNTDK